jgi:hypothetical protein
MSTNPPAQVPEVAWSRSPLFRTIFANQYRYKTGIGDISLTFANIIDGYPGKAPNTVEDQIGITMSWQQAKALSETLSMMISAVEDVVGEIKLPPAHYAGKENDRATFLAQIRSLYPAE